MSENYDREVWDAKDGATKTLLGLGSGKVTIEDMGHAVDRLNKAWDDLTNCLVRQRDERSSEVLRLLDELAEAKRKRP